MNKDWQIQKVSDALCRISAYDESELVGRPIVDILSEMNPEKDKAWLDRHESELKENRTLKGEIECLIREGGSFWMKYSISPVFSRVGEEKVKTGYTVIGHDISDRKKVETLSITDKLTGLVNRMRLDDVLEYEICLAERGTRSFSIIICDLDNFKLINDHHGHFVGIII